jgi:enoyl-[acyl-carrier protein] reductase II
MIKTRINEMLGIRYPLIQAGMGGVAQWELAAAVSEAGGLGVLGGAFLSPAAIRAQIRNIKAHTSRPYGVDLLLAEGTPMIEEVMEVLFEEDVPVFVSGLGSPGPWTARMHEQGMKVIALVGNARHARRCAADGCDIIVAQGHEAGGHTGRIPTLVTVPLIVDAVSPIPVVAAGGIGDGRGIAAALMLGAEGVLVGTRFIACAEATAHENYKEQLVTMSEEQTIVTRSYTGKSCRVIRNLHTEEWEKTPENIQPFPMQMMKVGQRAGTAIALGDMEYGMAPAGQVAGMIKDRPMAGELIERMMGEAEELLRRVPGQCLA